jgi:DNA-binding CsgD family transcriptional regulator
MALPSGKPVVCPVLIGRVADLQSLRSLIDQARSGAGGTILISGEAGIGKSRMVAEVKTYAAAQGFLLLQGNCFPADTSCPYAPLLDLLRSLHASSPLASLLSSLETLARDIFPLLPELVSERTIQPSGLEPEQEKRRLFAVLSTFFRQLSTVSPVLFVIEDAHWSDSASLDFLHYLTRRLTSHPILLLVTYRQEETFPLLNGWLAQLDRERFAHEVKLLRLSRSDVDTMLSAIFDERHTALDMRRFLHGELLDTMYTLTEGNPFFIEETLGSLVAEGDIFYTQGYWNRRSLAAMRIPRSVQEGVQRRTERLSEEARHVLTLAAVAGRHFDFALLQQLTGYDELRLLHIMKELVAAQLVVEESDERFAFRHALTRRAIYLQLLARERITLHRLIAQTLEQLPAALDAHLEELASHFYQAHEWQKALDYTRRAGEKAVQLYAHRAAINYFTWALEAAQHLSSPPSPLIYRARGQANEMLGEFEQAQHDYTRAMEAARAMDDRVGEWQSAIDLGFLWAGRDYTRTEIWFRQALMLAESLNDPALHARSLNRIGNWYLNVEQPHEALRCHREALALFEQLHDTHGIAETQDLLGMSSYLGGDLIGGTTYYRQAIALFDEHGNGAGLTSSLATTTLRATTYQTDMLASAASLAEVLSEAERALKIARDIGQRSAEAYALMLLGLCLGSQGEYSRALATDQQALAIAEEIEHRQWQAAIHTVLGGAYSGLFALPQARSHFEQALALARETHSLFWTHIATGYLASASILLHDYTRAETLLHSTFNPDRPARTMGQHLIWGAAIELALAQGYPQQALDIIDRLIPSDMQTDREKRGLRVLKLRGEALAAWQRIAEAEIALKAAQALAITQGARPMQWRIEVSLGNLYRSQGSNTEAELAYASARRLIEELASSVTDEALREHFLQQALAMLPHAGLSSPVRSSRKVPAGLTEREREVVVLIAQGKSNQAIADTLVVTKRTVETHVGNIMFKSGCSSRTQIAVWAVENGLVSKVETEPAT